MMSSTFRLTALSSALLLGACVSEQVRVVDMTPPDQLEQMQS